MSPNYSIVVLTLDEEANIRACLDSCCQASNDVHVLDSGSTDRTLAIAREYKVTVHEHPFQSFAQQRNWAITNILFRHEWLLHLDADERLTPALDQALRETVHRDALEDGFFLPSKLIFMGRWVKRADDYPKYQMRFFHRSRMTFVDYGHGQREQPGSTTSRIEEPYLHLPFAKGMDAWMARHIRYSQLEARQALEALSSPVNWTALASGDPVVRRRTLKAISYRLPFRAQLRWAMLAFIRGGILEGRPGLTYISLMSLYERLIAANISIERANRKSP